MEVCLHPLEALKAKTVRASSQQILTEFGGVVPGTMEGLTSLHGVGRKTASIVLGNTFKVQRSPSTAMSPVSRSVFGLRR